MALWHGRVLSSGKWFGGVANANGTVRLYLGEALLGTSSTTAQGRFAHALSASALDLIAANPQVGLRVFQTDAAGNRGESTKTPITTKLKPPVFSQLSIGGNDAVVSSQAGDKQISGTAEAGFAVKIFFNGNPLEAAPIADADGRFSAVLSALDITTIGQGASRTLTLQQIDDYGNLGEATTWLL